MNENVRQKEGKAFRPWCEDEFIIKVELPGIRQDQDCTQARGTGQISAADVKFSYTFILCFV